MAKSLSKRALIAELSDTTEIPQKEVKTVLDQLAEIAYRETVKGFTIPGICKLKIARRKASKCRNPATGGLMFIAEHDIVKITPLKKARDAIAPKADDLVTLINDAVEQTAPSPEPEETELFTFACPTCDQEIEAPTSMLGMEAECPTCGIELIVDEADSSESTTAEEETEENDKPFLPADSANTMRLDLSSLGIKQ